MYFFLILSLKAFFWLFVLMAVVESSSIHLLKSCIYVQFWWCLFFTTVYSTPLQLLQLLSYLLLRRFSFVALRMLNKLTIYIILKYSMSILTYGTLNIFDAST